jgi:hypothetical protein
MILYSVECYVNFLESKAEKLLIPAQDSPPYGYKSLQSRDLHSNIMRHETLQPSSTVKRA